MPFYLRGLWGSSLSRADEGLRNARTPDIRRDLIVAFGPQLPISTKTKELKQKVFDLSITAWQSYSGQLDPIPLAWLRKARRHPANKCIADSTGGSWTQRQMVAEVITLGRAMSLSGKAVHVGVVLPAGSAAAIATLAITLHAKVVVHLNYTADANRFRAAIEATSLQQVVTSRQFQQSLAEQGIDLDALLEGVEICYLEDLRQSIRPWRRALAKIQFAILPARCPRKIHQ